MPVLNATASSMHQSIPVQNLCNTPQKIFLNLKMCLSMHSMQVLLQQKCGIISHSLSNT